MCAGVPTACAYGGEGARALAVHFRRVRCGKRHSRDPTLAERTQQCVSRIAHASLPLDGDRGGGGGARRARSPESHSVTTATAEHGNRSRETITAVTVRYLTYYVGLGF